MELGGVGGLQLCLCGWCMSKTVSTQGAPKVSTRKHFTATRLLIFFTLPINGVKCIYIHHWFRSCFNLPTFRAITLFFTWSVFVCVIVLQWHAKCLLTPSHQATDSCVELSHKSETEREQMDVCSACVNNDSWNLLTC